LPVASGRRAALRPVEGSDYEHIRRAETSGDLLAQYRHLGVTVPPEQFSTTLWAGILTQFMIINKTTGAPGGIIGAYGADFRNGHAFLVALRFPQYAGQPWMLEGFGLFVDYLFKVFPFRKLYGDTLSFNFQKFSSGLDSLLIEEGRLREHWYYDGKYWDRVTVAIYRNDWETRRRDSPLVDQIRILEGGDRG
jgi:RimJ/RimL family protein N-acetyltransferase